MIRYTFIFALIVILLSCHMVRAASTLQDMPMPNGFSGLKIGMTIKDFVATHPNARPDPMDEASIDLKKPNHHIYELINDNSLFTYATYSFRAGKLYQVHLNGLCQGKQLEVKRTLFLSQLIALYGHPSSINIFEVWDPLRSAKPALIWHKKTYAVVGLYPLSANDSLNKGGSLQLVIGGDNFDTTNFDEAKITIGMKRRLIQDVQDDIRHVLK